MPLKPQYRKTREAFIAEYGEKLGEEYFWRWVNKHRLRDEVELRLPWKKGWR